MKYTQQILFSLALTFFVSCGHKYNIGVLPNEPVNLVEINSEFDDYNSTSPTLGETFPLCFSSNRGFRSDFDVQYRLMRLSFDKKTADITFSEETSANLDVVSRYSNLRTGIQATSTSFDEFGPYAIEYDGNIQNSAGTWIQPFVILYSNNSNGNQDILFTHNVIDGSYQTPKEVEFLNSEFDDAYPTFNKDLSSIYFTSNREGGIYNIYQIGTDNSVEIVEVLSNPNSNSVKKVDILSSKADDKCPFIQDNLLVFSSNREGGFGGYDLYYSFYNNGNWSTPENFGEKINTEYDEFRPINKPIHEFSNDLMIFSSNRPGGVGGFDLYYVGINQLRIDRN